PEAPQSYDLTSIRLFTHTGEPIDSDTWNWYFSWTNGRAPIINVSGGTELFAEILCSSYMQPLKSTCLGVSPAIKPIIVDDSGNPVSKGAAGYLCFTLPQPAQTRGFWNEDDSRYLQTYFPHGTHLWWHGDIVQVDEDGFWFHQGRADDVLKVAGRRTGPGEIEDIIGRIQAVQESAVIDVPHTLKGEEMIVFAVLKPNMTTSIQAIKQHIIDLLGKPYEPGIIYLVAELPKTRTGKIIRRLIKKHYLNEPQGDTSSLSNPEALNALPRQ
ncbi:MAG: AMP-binding protein, partial [Anaerolineae bacterium]|nr:AMP-binding protein [Anaerolineae bacterium]